MFPKTGCYVVTEIDKCHEDRIWTISKDEIVNKPYTYDEAINLTGHGFYSILLLVTGCLSVLGMLLDSFALPAVSSIAACELNIGTYEEKIIMTMPFIGAILTAYTWGYISDTRGRRFTLLVTVWGSFIASTLAAFSQHWVMLALLKFVSVACSSSTQSTSFTLVGESCATKVKVIYFFIMTAHMNIAFPIQIALHYFTLTLDFSVDLGVTTFTPWRMLAIVLALPLAACAICCHFIYESPKFLVNAGKEDEALEILTEIWKKNGQRGRKYPVTKIILNEGNTTTSEVTFLQSLWDQTIPLFRMPLLLRTLQLYFLTIVIYSACSGLLGWFPFLADAFILGSVSSQNSTEGLCNMISQYAHLKNSDAGHTSISCVPKSDLAVVWASLAQGVILSIVNCGFSLLAHRRKLLMIVTLLIPSLAALVCATVPSNAASLTAYFSIFLAVLGLGIIMSYFVDLYPTSYRGMASCLAIFIARFATIAAINVVGTLIIDHCSTNFLLISAYLLCGAVLSCFLPSDKQIKTQ